MTNKELNNLITKYYSEKNFKIEEIKQLGFFAKLRYNRLFKSAHIYNNIFNILIRGNEFREKFFYREINLTDMNGKEFTKYIDITVVDYDNIEIDEFDCYEI